MAKAQFNMKFAGYKSFKSKAGKEYNIIQLLEEVEVDKETGRKCVKAADIFCDQLPANIKDYNLYQDVEVVLEVNSSGEKPKFIDML